MADHKRKGLKERQALDQMRSARVRSHTPPAERPARDPEVPYLSICRGDNAVVRLKKR